MTQPGYGEAKGWNPGVSDFQYCIFNYNVIIALNSNISA